jgi:hypothetical protein
MKYNADKNGVITIHGMDAIRKAMADDDLLQIGGNNDKEIGEFVYKTPPVPVVEPKPIKKKGKKKDEK